MPHKALSRFKWYQHPTQPTIVQPCRGSVRLCLTPETRSDHNHHMQPWIDHAVTLAALGNKVHVIAALLDRHPKTVQSAIARHTADVKQRTQDFIELTLRLAAANAVAHSTNAGTLVHTRASQTNVRKRPELTAEEKAARKARMRERARRRREEGPRPEPAWLVEWRRKKALERGQSCQNGSPQSPQENLDQDSQSVCQE